jgi:hypothetical protein
MTHKISLSENEQRIAEWVGKKRTANARRKNLPDTKIGDQSFEETDLEGFAAELAFCKLMNIYPDLETGDNLPNYDCVDCNGVTYDVKTTNVPHGHLMATLKKKKNPPDKYVLSIGVFPDYDLIGEIGAKELLQVGNIKNFGKGPCYALTQAELNPINI